MMTKFFRYFSSNNGSAKDLPKNVRFELVTVFVLIVSAIIVLSLYTSHKQVQDDQERRIQRDLKEVKAIFSEVIEHEMRSMEMALVSLTRQESLIDPFLRQDREALLDASLPMYEKFNKNNRITHFYFTKPDQINFLRVHLPDHHSDRIERYTTKEAVRQHKTISGLELSALGTLALRSVSPWFDEGELIGYMELGMEVNHVLALIEKELNIKLSMAIHQDYINEYETRLRTIDSEQDPSFQANEYFVISPFLDINQDYVSYYENLLSNEPELLIGFKVNGQSFMATSIPLTDARGLVVGRLIIDREVTNSERILTAQHANNLAHILALALFALLFFYQRVNRVHDALENTYTQLDSSLRSRTEEYIASEKKLRDAQDLAKIGSWEYDLETQTLTWSHQIFEIIEKDASQNLACYKLFLSSIHPEDLQMVKEEYTLARERSEPHSIVYRLLMKDGRVKWVQEQSEPTFSPSGDLQGYGGSLQDITDIKRAELAIWENEKRYRSMFHNVTEGIVVINDQGIMSEFNAAAERMFGYTSDEVIGKNVSMLMPDPDRHQHDGYLRAHKETGVAKIIGKGREVKGLKKSGERFPMYLGLGIMHIKDSRYFIGSITDLTAMKNLETQLRRSQKMEAIGELTGGIAHDFNNILGIVIGELDLVKRKLKDEVKLIERIEKVQRAASRGANLTRQLLDFARHSSVAITKVNINKTIQNLKGLIAKSLTTRISIELELADDLWPVEIESDALEDALINLALNAKDAIPGSGTIILRTQNISLDESFVAQLGKLKAGDYVELTILDNGSGMTPEVLERVFEPFFSTKEEGKGTGLGLPMVFGFVERSGGHMHVYSEVGLGTTFKIYLPRAAQHLQEVLSHSKTLPNEQLRGSLNGTETILVVDDEAALLEIAESVLTEHGYQVLTASDGGSAVKVLQEHPEVDCLFSDVMMPGDINGFELAEQAQKLKPDIRVLLTSGYMGKLSGSTVADKWSSSILSKPYRGSELADRIRAVLDE